MEMMWITLLVVSFLAFAKSDKMKDENIAQQFLEFADKLITSYDQKSALAQFNFNTNITDENQEIIRKLSKERQIFDKELWTNATKFDFEHFQNESIRRQFKTLSIQGISALPPEEAEQYEEISSKMEGIYSSATVCLKDKCGIELEPELQETMANSRDYDELEEAWTAWRDSAGKPIHHLYKEFTELGNKVATLNGFPSMDVYSLEPWDTKDFKEQIEELWEELRPIYQILHTYVRMKLRQKYGSRMPSDGTIPAHLLGNMWAQHWDRIRDLVEPFPNKKTLDVTNAMIKQNYTVIRMVKMAEEFFTDIGLMPMTQEFWNNSMFVKPEDRKVVCPPSASDMSTKTDFRIKMCALVNMFYLNVFHHEMGHVEYYMEYRDQPALFRTGANPGFHEAVGDAISLSVSTPSHLYKKGLYEELDEDFEMTINYQMSKALEKLAFLPFGYLVDLWRWDVQSGKVSYDQWNRRWWELRLQYQGLSPPNKRTETDFDPGAKYHIPASVEYIRYFVSYIIQFQFHKALCSIAQPNAPLHKCDIDKNKEAGERLSAALSLGSSKPWPDVMEVLTGSKRMSSQPFIEYFEPLFKYLKTQIKNEKIGWNSSGLLSHY